MSGKPTIPSCEEAGVLVVECRIVSWDRSGYPRSGP